MEVRESDKTHKHTLAHTGTAQTPKFGVSICFLQVHRADDRMSSCWEGLSESESVSVLWSVTFLDGNLCVCGSILWKCLEFLGHNDSSWLFYWIRHCG